jgi:HPt (histidine-containing phosphotransfer) domain-containing protein
MRRLMGDEAAVKVIISGFLVDIPKRIENLKSSLSAGDARMVERELHTIKGASSNVGADALHAISEELDQLAKSGDLAGISARLPELESSFASLKRLMTKLVTIC